MSDVRYRRFEQDEVLVFVWTERWDGVEGHVISAVACAQVALVCVRAGRPRGPAGAWRRAAGRVSNRTRHWRFARKENWDAARGTCSRECSRPVEGRAYTGC
jgi:hypothetical protein